MGLVYRGVQLSVERPVAIKVIRDDLSRDPATAERFLREARLATTLSHPNIVNIFDLGQTETGAVYIVMEMLRGRTLEAELRRGAFDARRTCDVAIQLCDALAAAHARGIVHRDLKPANVMLLDDPAVRDLVKVLDFGVARSLSAEATRTASRLTLAGELMGTPQYMAPEAIADDIVDGRSDLYALGCVMHEMLAGSPPFDGRAPHVVLARQVADPPPPLPATVPAPIAILIEALLAKTPDERPASAASVRDLLHAYLATFPEEAMTLDELETVLREVTPRRFAAGTTAPPTIGADEPTVIDARALPELVTEAKPPARSWPWWFWTAAIALMLGVAALIVLYP
jgi:eukaryotic-like serine/threonine-protein kinase